MPKGKARKQNPGLYEGSPERPPPSMAPQAVAHKRGGTHRVRDEDRTGSVYDTFNYKELVTATKERNIYVKDMKKGAMAQALKTYDDDQRRIEREALVERERRLQEAKRLQEKQNKEKLAKDRARHQRNLARERRREAEKNVSEDSLSSEGEQERIEAEHARLNGHDEYTCETLGQALSEESWDSTSSDSSTQSLQGTIQPDSKLRLYEWPWEFLPLRQPRPPSSEYLPVKSRYAPLRVITTESKQKLSLPGQMYPPGVAPDYVPILPPETRTAARNGILEGVLRNARIERASEWATRTLIQGWNGRMYFTLPSRDSSKNLADVYDKWNIENRKLLKVRGGVDGVRADRERRHVQRHRNRSRMVVDVYEASEYRPGFVCYVPAALDFEEYPGGGGNGEDLKEKEVGNLFYVRFPGCDVPHYYFWTREGEWREPTAPNLCWKKLLEEGQGEENSTTPHSLQNHPYTTPPRQTRRKIIRVKRPNALVSPSFSSSPPVIGTISTIEHSLYTNGLRATLSTLKATCLAHNKHRQWKTFACSLPVLFPSGILPDAPPVHAAPGTYLASKMARMQDDDNDDNDDEPGSPLRGNEAWTRDDEALWEVVEVEVDMEVDAETTEDDNQESSGKEVYSRVDALCRRQSVCTRTRTKTRSNGERALMAWLAKLPPVHRFTSSTHTWEVVNKAQQSEWEDKYLKPQTHASGRSIACPFCSLRWTDWDNKRKAQHMHGHSAVARLDSTTPPPPPPPPLQTSISHQYTHATLSTSPSDGEQADSESTSTSRHARNIIKKKTLHYTPHTRLLKTTRNRTRERRTLITRPPRNRKRVDVQSLDFLDTWAGTGVRKRKMKKQKATR